MEQRVGLASRAAARSAVAHQQHEAELHEVQGVHTSPRRQQRERCCGGTSGAEDVEPSQLIEQFQSLLCPEISEPESSQQSGVSLTVKHVNVETQLTTETGLFDGVDDDEEDDNVGSVKRSARGGRNDKDDDEEEEESEGGKEEENKGGGWMKK